MRKEKNPDDMNEEQVLETAAEEKPEKQEGISAENKNALMRYLTIMFAGAFLIVLVSFLIQNYSSNAQISELSTKTNNIISNVETLQAQNRALQDANIELQKENEALMEEIEALKTEQQNGRQASSEMKETVETYEALVVALSCTTKEGNLSYSKAIETLKVNQRYLSEAAQRIYRRLLSESTGE